VGIAPADVLGFVSAELIAALVMVMLFCRVRK
jgi:hypothetical protein